MGKSDIGKLFLSRLTFYQNPCKAVLEGRGFKPKIFDNETNVWGARYYFSLSIPENAGEALGRVTINQRQGFEEIEFKLKDTQAFVGTPRHKDQRLTLKDVTKDPHSPTISVTFEPPVKPGTTVTLELRPTRNPRFSGVYIFGVTAFPAVENPYGLYLGVGRLQFYDGRSDFFFR